MTNKIFFFIYFYIIFTEVTYHLAKIGVKIKKNNVT